MAVDAGLYCLNVGQGSCTVIVDRIAGRAHEFQAAIVDVGADGRMLARWLRYYGVTRIVTIALTHHDADHIRGLAQLVQAFQKKIETLWVLPDREAHPKRLWMPSQKWIADGWIRRSKRLEAPSECPPGMGERLVGPTETEYALYCIYPDVYDAETVLHDAPQPGTPLGTGPNAASAVLRIAVQASTSPGLTQTQVLIGGDLDYLGWRHLVESGHDLRADIFVVPHHGGPAEVSPEFGESELVAAVRPSSALISVGTDKNSGPRSYGHPHKSLVQALRHTGANVLCTQITPQCVIDPSTITDGSVLSRVLPEPATCVSGVSCAGTIVAQLTDTAPPVVRRINDHAMAVDKLQAAGHSPLCR